MNESILDDFKNDFALFIEAGFVAVKQLDEKAAKQLFGAAELLQPQSTAAQIGLGYISLNKLEVSNAMKIFQAVLEKEPENYLAQAFLGICYLLKKSTRKEGEELIEKTKKSSEDPTIQNLCEVSLQWADKDLKRIKAPFFSSKD